MDDTDAINPKLAKLCELARRIAKKKAQLARLEVMLANWPTKKPGR